MTTSLVTDSGAGTRRNRWSFRHLRRSLLAAALLGIGLTGAYPVPAAHADATFNQRLTALINQDRSANGLTPLAVHAQMASIAEDAPWTGCGFSTAGRAADMGRRNYFSHTIANCAGNDLFDIMSSAALNYSWAGENIGWASGTADPAAAAQQLHNAFMASPGHRANVLSANATHVGVGSWRTATGQTWSGTGTARSNVWLTAVVFARTPTAAARVPSAPAVGATSTVAGSVDVSWAPAAPNGAAVDTHVAYAYTAAGYTGRYVVTCGWCTATRITGLRSGVPHYVTVYAHNSVGWGPPGSSRWVTAR